MARLSAVAGAIGFLLLLFLAAWLLGDPRKVLGPAVPGPPGPTRAQLVHVCVASEDTDLRSVAALIRSVSASAARPELLRFHVITTPALAPLFKRLLATHLRKYRAKVHADADEEERIQSLVGVREKDATSRTASGAIALAPFFHESFVGKNVQGVKRVVFLEKDTLVLGDIGELMSVNLQGHALGAVRTCSTRMSQLVRYRALKGQTLPYPDGKACTASRAVMVINLERWQELKVTSRIEEWMAVYEKAPLQPWTGGMAVVPWLLSIGDAYADLGEQWLCGGLGQDIMSFQASQVIRRAGLDKWGLKRLGLRTNEIGNISPQLTMCTATAKLLQLDGAMAPWRADRSGAQQPMCVLPGPLLAERRRRALAENGLRARLFCEWSTFVNCSALWRSFLPEEVACALKDFDAEWAEAEIAWDKAKSDRDFVADMEWSDLSRLFQRGAQDTEPVMNAEGKLMRDSLSSRKDREARAVMVKRLAEDQMRATLELDRQTSLDERERLMQEWLQTLPASPQQVSPAPSAADAAEPPPG